MKINVKLDDFCDTSKQLLAENNKKTDELKAVSEKLIQVTEKVNQLLWKRSRTQSETDISRI